MSLRGGACGAGLTSIWRAIAGEVAELREELLNPSKEKKKDAVKKVIAAMTVGKDVSSLFPDVVKCIQTDNLELKKLVYLYVINYAKTQPDLALLAVNTFQRVRPPLRCPRRSDRLKHPPTRRGLLASL